MPVVPEVRWRRTTVLRSAREIVAERRMIPLARAQHFLVGEGKLGEPVERIRRRQPPPMRGDAAAERASDVFALAFPRALTMGSKVCQIGEVRAFDRALSTPQK